MNKNKFIPIGLGIILFLLVNINTWAQSDTTIQKVKYTHEFKFDDGLYLTYNHFINNTPVEIKYIITESNASDFYFFNHLVENEEIAYVDKFGLRQIVKTEDIWGFCRQGDVFIQIEGEFHRIPVIGSLCHFIANKNVQTSASHSPYYYDSYGYQRYNTPTTTSQVVEQYILDTASGKVFEFERSNLLSLFTRDPELYDEFNNMNKRKQRKNMYLFLRKFNQRNPLFIPKGK